MTSSKAPIAPFKALCSSTSPKLPVVMRRAKSVAQAANLTIDTDVWQPMLMDAAATQHSASTASSEVSSPSPPASMHHVDDENMTADPFYQKISAWGRDVHVPGLGPANMDESTSWVAPNGARLSGPVFGRQLLLPVNGSRVLGSAGIGDLLRFGMTRYATRLTVAAGTGHLVRTRVGGKKVSLRAGSYAFIIDQAEDLLVSLTASSVEGAAAGAHLCLSAGLPVLYAGELTVVDGTIISYAPQSGSYRTPSTLDAVAANHPLLRDACCIPNTA